MQRPCGGKNYGIFEKLEKQIKAHGVQTQGEMKCRSCLHSASNPWLLSSPAPRSPPPLQTPEAARRKGPHDHRSASPARCGGAAGVVNQAVANQRTATSQHQGHTPPQAALQAPAPITSAPRPSVIDGAPPSPPEPQQVTFWFIVHMLCGHHRKHSGPEAVSAPTQTAPRLKKKATPGSIYFLGGPGCL